MIESELRYRPAATIRSSFEYLMTRKHRWLRGPEEISLLLFLERRRNFH